MDKIAFLMDTYLSGPSPSPSGEIETIAAEIQKLATRARREAQEHDRVSGLVVALLSAAADELRRECDRLRESAALVKS
jgi:hypothetical protein